MTVGYLNVFNSDVNSLDLSLKNLRDRTLTVDHRKQMGFQVAAAREVKPVWLKEFDGKPHLIAFCS